jgi:hypothetical protein
VTAKGGLADASIPPGGTLTIGYGSTGTQPHTYTLLPEQDVDVGYLKLFLSTQHVDFSSVEQKSPFELHGGMVGMTTIGEVKKVSMWDTKIVTIVQKRKDVVI